MEGLSPAVDILWRLVFVGFILCFFMETRSQCFHSLMSLKADNTIRSFNSPGYPAYYAANDRCYWLIMAANSSHVVRIDVEDSYIEYHKNCEWDYVRVYDGPSEEYEPLGTFCGSAEPTYVSTKSFMYLVLVSDFSETFKGFKIKYYSGKKESLTDSTPPEKPDDDTPIVIGATFGGILGFIIITGMIYSWYTTKKHKRRTRRVREERVYNRMDIVRTAPDLRSGPSGQTHAARPQRQQAWVSFQTNVSTNYFMPPTYTPGPPPPYREHTGATAMTSMSPPPPYEFIAPNQTHSFSSPSADT